MTIHQPISHANRRALPRSLIARRPIQNAQEFQFAIGDVVRLIETGATALVASRMQTADSEDEYVIEFIGSDAAPADVFEWQIEAVEPQNNNASAPMRQRRTFDFRWKFEVGQRICFDGVPGVILSGGATAKGRQFFNVWIDVALDDRPFRWVFGDKLTVRDFNSSAVRDLELAK